MMSSSVRPAIWASLARGRPVAGGNARSWIARPTPRDSIRVWSTSHSAKVRGGEFGAVMNASVPSVTDRGRRDTICAGHGPAGGFDNGDERRSGAQGRRPGAVLPHDGAPNEDGRGGP